HRVNLLKDILVSFNSLCNSYRGITEGMLFSAFALDKKTIADIELAISKKEGRKVSLIFKIDPSLIGGVKVVINNHIYDGSVKNKLVEMKQSLS
ncbi:MAG: ATP synthase F1 subunit delta, partial [Bacilli bacterium]|nr:ATP synthase F1 subunit delta [Bacilli bacterium]